MRRLSTLSSSFSTTALRAVIWGANLLSQRRPGQGLVEYGLILVMIMVVCISILTLVGKNVSELWYGKIIGAF